MKTRMMRRIAVLVTGSALALSLPVASSVANSGGVPNDGNGHSKACSHRGQGNGPKPNTHRKANMDKGHKCGLRRLED